MPNERESRRVRIFIASPSDVEQERDQLAKVVNSLNSTIAAVAPEKRITLELVRYETHTYPGFSRDGAQGTIWDQLGDIGDYDIFIGVMWKRFGTPTPHAQSGTEEEFKKAYAALMGGLKKLKHVIFYFCQEKIAIPRTRDEWEQLGKVITFKEELSGIGRVGEYTDRESFDEIVKSHLDQVLSRIFSERSDVASAAERVGEVALDNSDVREQITSLAGQYFALRKLPYSDERTRMLEAVFTQMKGLAFLAYSLLPELTKSVSQNGGRDEHVGERVAAIALLEALPNAKYLDWLADRFGQERPFVGYHAGVALLNAARSLKETHRDQLRLLIKQALNKVPNGTDRDSVLQAALAELETQRAG